MSRTAREAARHVLTRVLPTKTIEQLNQAHGLHIAPGATVQDALNARILHDAARGDPEAKEAARRYGLE